MYEQELEHEQSDDPSRSVRKRPEEEEGASLEREEAWMRKSDDHRHEEREEEEYRIERGQVHSENKQERWDSSHTSPHHAQEREVD